MSPAKLHFNWYDTRAFAAEIQYVIVVLIILEGLILPNSFGLLSGPIFLENLACSGSEARLVDCQHNVIGTHECDHSQDAAVQCFGRRNVLYVCIRCLGIGFWVSLTT